MLLALISNKIYPKYPFCRVHLIDCILEQECTEILLQIHFTWGFGSTKILYASQYCVSATFVDATM